MVLPCGILYTAMARGQAGRALTSSSSGSSSSSSSSSSGSGSSARRRLNRKIKKNCRLWKLQKCKYCTVRSTVPDELSLLPHAVLTIMNDASSGSRMAARSENPVGGWVRLAWPGLAC
jgi:hypothetical protein